MDIVKLLLSLHRALSSQKETTSKGYPSGEGPCFDTLCPGLPLVPKKTVRRAWSSDDQILASSGTSENLAHQNEVTLMWVPGEHGISGNEAADWLARVGLVCLFTGLEPFCGLSASQLREVVVCLKKEGNLPSLV